MASAARKAALKLPGWSDTEKKKGIKAETLLKIDSQQILRTLAVADVQTIVSKSKEGTVDLSSPQFQFETADFLADAPDTIKVLILSDGSLADFGGNRSASHLSKLKRLELNGNSISSVNLKGLKGLEAISLASNRLDSVPDFTDQEELVYLDLSGNRITSGFSELGKLKNLKVLDLGDCGLDLAENEFFNFVLVHLKKLQKLEYINFSGNPVQSTIREFRYFAIQELPRLKYLNWDLIAKEDRSFAGDLATSGTWDDKTKTIAQHSASGNSINVGAMTPGPRSTAPTTEKEKAERHIKQGTYAAHRLGELLAAEEAKSGGNNSSSSNGALTSSGGISSSSNGLNGSKDGPTKIGDAMEDLDAILDMVSGKDSKNSDKDAKNSQKDVKNSTSQLKVQRTASGSPQPMTASSSTSSVLDELDAMLNAATAPLMTPGNRGSYVDTLTGVLDGVDDSNVPNSSSSTAPSSSADPLSELDDLLSGIDFKTPSEVPKKSPSGHAVSSITASGTPPPPSRPTSMMASSSKDPDDDALDAILADIESNVASPSATSETASRVRNHTKPRSTIFEDLESDIFALESDHVSRTQTPSPVSSQKPSKEASSVSSTPTPPVSPPKMASPAPAPTSIADNDELDFLEREIQGLTSISSSSSSNNKTVTQNAPPTKPINAATNNTNETKNSSPPPVLPAAPSNPAIEVLQPQAQRPAAYQQQPATGSGLAALANFTSNISASQFDSLLDSFDSASAKALTTPPVTTVSPPLPSSQAQSQGVASTPNRSLQRGPRPSAIVPLTPGTSPRIMTNPWEIPAEDLLTDFLLGRGVWGETYEGTWKVDRASGKSITVAIKRLFNKDFTPEAVAKFKEETKDLLQLNAHENLIPVLGCSVRDTKQLLWKGVNGVPLWGFLRNPSNVVTPTQVLAWSRQLASALAYLHSQQIIHGGVKTSNLILDREQKLLVKDYGFLDFKDEMPLVDSDPRWLAPEVIVARETGYNEKIDVYAFGMVVYEMMMRESPFITMKPTEIIEALSYRIIRPETVPGIFPPLFIRLLAACWSHEPSERPSMEKVVKILENSDDRILGDYAHIHLEMPNATKHIATKPNFNPMNPRPSEPPKPNPSIISASSSSSSDGSPLNSVRTSGSPKMSPRVTMLSGRAPAASVGHMSDGTAPLTPPSPTPSRPALRVAKPSAMKAFTSEDLNLEVDQERKLVALLSKLSELLASGDPDQQARAMNTLVEVVKDEKRINYVAKRSLLPRDLVEMLRANSVDAINSWRMEYPRAFETIELLMRTTTSLSSTNTMIEAFLKHGMMLALVDFASRGVDSLKILAAQAIHELCLIEEGRTQFRKSAGMTSLMAMLKVSKNEFVQAQAAWTLASALDDDYNQEDFINAGGLQVMEKLVTSPNAAIRLRVLDALSNLWNNEKARDLCVQYGLKDKLLNMLATNSEILQLTALRGLGKFSRHAHFQPTEIESLRILKAASEIISNPEKFMRDRLNAIQICDNLTAHEKTMLTNFRDMGGMSLMVKSVSDPEPQIRIAAIQIIQRALNDDRSRDAIIALGAVTPLITQLASKDNQVRIKAMSAVDTLIKFPKGKVAVVANAGVSRIISIVAFSDSPQEQVLALKLLDFFSDNLDYKEEVREAGGLTALLENFGTFPAEAKLWACINVGHLCSTEKNRQALVEQKGISPLITTIQALLRVAEHTHSQKSLNDHFVPDAQLHTLVKLILNLLFNLSEIGEYRPTLRDADAASFACEMASSYSEDIQLHAVRSLTGLAADPKNKVVIRTGASKKLKELATTSSNALLSQQANQVLTLIDANAS